MSMFVNLCRPKCVYICSLNLNISRHVYISNFLSTYVVTCTYMYLNEFKFRCATIFIYACIGLAYIYVYIYIIFAYMHIYIIFYFCFYTQSIYICIHTYWTCL